MDNQGSKTDLKWYEKKRGVRASQKERQKESSQKELARQRARKEESESKQSKSVKATTKDNSHTTTKIKVQCTDSLFDTSAIPQDALKILNSFNKTIMSAYPLSSKQRAMLPKDIRELSHFLTDERSDRRLGYMNKTTTLSAYVHYYLWWNLVRLTRLFANLPSSFFNLKDDNVCIDIGSGPLTVPIALFMARPELRKLKLTWYCVDISSQALSIGENLLLSVAAQLECESWKIVRVKGELGTAISQKADLITSANVFNEIVQDSDMPPDYLAKKYSDKLLSYTNSKNSKRSVLMIEPGVPASARFVSLMRDAFMRKGYKPLSPCTHCWECPMDGKRGGKWCNYAFSTEDAPLDLKKLSEASRLPKERAVLSFVACVHDDDFAGKKTETVEPGKETQENADNAPTMLTFRIASDPIRLPGNRTGYYACSAKGLLLIITQQQMQSGQSYSIKNPKFSLNTDTKSGALILNI